MAHILLQVRRNLKFPPVVNKTSQLPAGMACQPCANRRGGDEAGAALSTTRPNESKQEGEEELIHIS